MKKLDSVKLKVTQQGAPIVNFGVIIEIGENIVAIEIDLKSKYCEVMSSFSGSKGECGVCIGTSERSLYLNDKVDKDDFTSIEFPEFKNWYVFATWLGRYTLNVCLIKY